LAFKTQFDSLDPELADLLDKEPETERVAHVWVRHEVLDDMKVELQTGAKTVEDVALVQGAKVANAVDMARADLLEIPGLTVVSEPQAAQYAAPYVVVRGARDALSAAGRLKNVWKVVWQPPYSDNNPYTWLHHYGRTTKNYTIKVCMISWNGLSSSTMGVAWASSAPQ
ncbi:MAG TPA: hypothetical protein PKA88_33380, partial [Polyangiaceae bacterium]|nr:hypothetical protein [Polyangiaceae bacterium]